MKIKAVLFDFGNVFSTFDMERLLDNLSPFTDRSRQDIVRILDGTPDRPGLSWQFQAGAFDADEFHRRLGKALGAREGFWHFDTFIHAWTNIFEKENLDLHQVFVSVRSDVQPYLISNCDEIHYSRSFLSHPVLIRHIPEERRILSYRARSMKPSEEIYRFALQLVGARPEEVFLVDDMERNISGWKALGGHGVVYHAGEHGIEHLEGALRTAGILE